MKRYCKTFYCDHLGDRVCCVSCRFYLHCENSCQNHFLHCGLEDKERKANDPRQKSQTGVF